MDCRPPVLTCRRSRAHNAGFRDGVIITRSKEDTKLLLRLEVAFHPFGPVTMTDPSPRDATPGVAN